MAHEWSELTRLTRGQEFAVSRARLKNSGIEIGGEFELPPLARLSYEDQVFVAMFVKSHGSIKAMEQAFGVSYPTIKARLNNLGRQLDFVDIEPVSAREDVLAQLERGEIDAAEASRRLRGEG